MVANPPASMTARPHKLAVVAWVCALGILAVFAGVATGLSGETEGGGMFGRGDQAAMVGLGLLMALGILSFARPRVWADEKGVRVRNITGSYDLPWELVRGVRFDDNSPWAALDLADDDTVAVMAIQRTDHGRALTAVRALRALLAEHQRKAAGPAD